jgi:hypothetical protein
VTAARYRGRRPRPFWLLIVSLVLVNGYAYTRLSALAGHWTLSLMRSPLSASMTQLALVLALNNAVILYLLLTRR